MKLARMLLLILMLLVSSASTDANNSYNIKGEITDYNNIPITYMNIILLNRDSTFITGTSTNGNGNFIIRFVKPGKYALRLSHVGFIEKTIPLIITNQDVDLGIVRMEESVQELKAAEVKGTQIRVVQKGDTTEYNANSFKVSSDATAEELVSKMPGITVDDGKVQAHGEDVKKVTIDGYEYFGDDAAIALRNLPAEIISKIQVFDKQSDQAQFSGFMDANTIKTMNIITKNPGAKFYFGKIYGGFGTNERYQSGGNLNFFNGNQRITLLGASNNINQQNFSSEDLLGVTAGGMGISAGMSARPPGVGSGSSFGQSGNDFYVGSQGGINTTNSFGINYIDKWGHNISVNGSYFYNQMDNYTTTNTIRDYFFQETDSLGANYVEDRANESTNLNHRVKLKIDYKVNHSNRIVFTPKLSFQSFQGLENINARNSSGSFETLNETITKNTGENAGYALFGELLYMHKFDKEGRTLSINLNAENNNSDQVNQSDFLIYDFVMDSISDLSKQQTGTDYSYSSYMAQLNYTEKISDKLKLLLNYTPSLVNSGNYKENFLFKPSTNEYTLFDSLLSNSFESTVVSHKTGFTIQHGSPKTILNIGVAFQSNQLQNEYLFPETDAVSKTYHSMLPTVMFMYKFTSSTNIRLFLRSGNTLPSISQLQEVVDNTNPLQLYHGNSDLKQDSYKMLLGRFGTANTDKGNSFFAFFMMQYKNDFIGNSTYMAYNDTLFVDGIELPPNTQLTTYKNFDKYFNARSFVTFGIPIKALLSNLNINGGIGFSQIPGETNELLNYAYTTNLNLGAVFSSNISENIDYTLSYSGSINWTNNSALQFNNSNYSIHKAGLKFKYIASNRLLLNTETNLNIYKGLENLPTNTPFIINAAIGYKFLKNRSLQAQILVYDMLDQNMGVTRNVNAAFSEDVGTNVMSQYFMLSLSYKFNTLM